MAKEFYLGFQKSHCNYTLIGNIEICSILSPRKSEHRRKELWRDYAITFFYSILTLTRESMRACNLYRVY